MAKAAINPTSLDWPRLISQLTDATFGFPPDVVFQIVENDQVHEIDAHKVILGMVSPVFKTMFSTDVGEKTSKVFKIEMTTANAFQIVKDAIYNNKSIGESLEGKSVDEVFQVVELIERFQIDELKKDVKDYITNYPITEDTVLQVAEEAMEYNILFEDESRLLLVACAQFLIPKLQDAKYMLRKIYAKENKDREKVIATVLALMADIVPCPNCKYPVCQNGKPVKQDEFRKGLIVRCNIASGHWGKNDYGIGKITKIKGTSLTWAQVKPGVTQNGITGYICDGPKFYTVRYPDFLFSCN